MKLLIPDIYDRLVCGTVARGFLMPQRFLDVLRNIDSGFNDSEYKRYISEVWAEMSSSLGRALSDRRDFSRCVGECYRSQYLDDLMLFHDEKDCGLPLNRSIAKLERMKRSDPTFALHLMQGIFREEKASEIAGQNLAGVLSGMHSEDAGRHLRIRLMDSGFRQSKNPCEFVKVVNNMNLMVKNHDERGQVRGKTYHSFCLAAGGGGFEFSPDMLLPGWAYYGLTSSPSELALAVESTVVFADVFSRELQSSQKN